MNIENPVAFSFIMQDDIYLLKKDKPELRPGTLPADATGPILETPGTNYNYFGKHKKQFLIIVYYPGLEFMAPDHLTALESTLKRLEFAFEDVAIFNVASYPDASFKQLADFFTPQKLLLLGRHALPPGIEPLELNKLRRLNNRHTLFTHSFEEMMNNNENKKAFWEQMKLL